MQDRALEAAVIPILDIAAGARIQGKGGNGAVGTNPGSAGGVAFVADDLVVLTGAGEIWSGGGGGSGNGGFVGAAAGGGGGAGTPGGAGGDISFSESQDGRPGTSEAGGAGGTGSGGVGAAGGDPGQAGESIAAAGGAAGSAIDGVSLCTFTSPNELDIRGSQIN